MTHTANAAEDILGDLSKTGMKLLSDSIVDGQTVRQCSCKEQDVCFAEVKTQVTRCIDSCWYRIDKLTPRPNDLRACFNDQAPFVETFLGCIGSNIHSNGQFRCYPSEDGPQIPKQDFGRLLNLGEGNIETSRAKIMRHSAIQPIRRVVETALEFGACVKACFIKENECGSCFERFQCQPLVQENRAQKTLKKCVKSVNWKAKAGELCQCSLNAGVSELSELCPMLKLMTAKTRIPR
ncbi:unnamed protein product [Toxocara canis]|uniref:Chondroitin proteoglycan 4 domain-containing protein n=1 Tax=Toxocara canis TaxID=6265 RepID=A0A183UJL6_TOXCA|nr:unnamed protein product [Toxocara canis]